MDDDDLATVHARLDRLEQALADEINDARDAETAHDKRLRLLEAWMNEGEN